MYAKRKCASGASLPQASAGCGGAVCNPAGIQGHDRSPSYAIPLLIWTKPLKKGKNILLEGQLGTLKDPDHGIYPMVTSSSTLAAYGAIGAGIPPYEIRRIGYRMQGLFLRSGRRRVLYPKFSGEGSGGAQAKGRRRRRIRRHHRTSPPDGLVLTVWPQIWLPSPGNYGRGLYRS